MEKRKGGPNIRFKCPVHNRKLKPFKLNYFKSNHRIQVPAGYCSICRRYYVKAPDCEKSQLFYRNDFCKKDKFSHGNYKGRSLLNLINMGARVTDKRFGLGTIVRKHENEIEVSYSEVENTIKYFVPLDIINGTISLQKKEDNDRLLVFLSEPVKNIGAKKKEPIERIAENEKIQEMKGTKILKVTHTVNRNIRSINDVVYKFQLVGSSNNHFSVGHNVTNEIIRLAYAEKDGTISKVELVAHYCSKCKKYFEFDESFILQLEEHNLRPERFLTRFEDRFLMPVGFSVGLKEDNLHEHSKLNLLGYRVGAKGLSLKARHELLDFVLTTGLMTASEIKNMLQFYIRFNGKRKTDMEEAIFDWKSDIKYVNDWILKNGIE